MLFFYPGLIILFLLFSIAKGFMNFDEEFVIFLCLLIVFITIIENLGDSILEYSSAKIAKIKGWYLVNWNEHLSRLDKQRKVLLFLQKFVLHGVYFFFKTVNSFIFFISYNFNLKNLYLNLLVKEIFFSFEMLENTANTAYTKFVFDDAKTKILNSLNKENAEFPINSFKIALSRVSKKNKK